MSVDALIFDVDGTMADTEEAHRRAFNLAFARLRLGWKWSRAEYRELLERQRAHRSLSCEASLELPRARTRTQ